MNRSYPREMVFEKKVFIQKYCSVILKKVWKLE
jgi:hypothetical protein